MYVWSFCLHTYVFTTCVLETERCQKALPPGTRVADGYGSSRGYWDSNPGPSEEQQVLLTAKPSLQPLGNFLKVRDIRVQLS